MEEFFIFVDVIDFFGLFVFVCGNWRGKRVVSLFWCGRWGIFFGWRMFVVFLSWWFERYID